MDPVVIILAGANVASVVGLVLTVMWAKGAMDRRADSDVAKNAAESAKATAERARDLALADAAKSAADLALVSAQLAATSKSLVSARAEVESNVRRTLSSGSDADVAAEVDRLLGNVPAVRGAEAAGADCGGPAAPAVPGSTAPTTGGAGRPAGG